MLSEYFCFTFVSMNTAANIEQFTQNTPETETEIFTPLPVPRYYVVENFIKTAEWSRTTIYMAIKGKGGKAVSAATRRKVRAALLEDIRRWEEIPAL